MNPFGLGSLGGSQICGVNAISLNTIVCGYFRATVQKSIRRAMNMTEEQKWDYINQLDEELLRGGVILSEWTTF